MMKYGLVTSLYLFSRQTINEIIVVISANAKVQLVISFLEYLYQFYDYDFYKTLKRYIYFILN